MGEVSYFAILRTNKIKDISALRGASEHNSRRASKGLEHAFAPSPRFNGRAELLLGQEDALEAWPGRLAAVGLDINGQRKDSVKAIEMLLTASSGWFEQASTVERAEWVQRSLKFAVEKFGRSNILSAHLHDDEETPHLQVLAIPLSLKGRAKRGRKRKGRESQQKRPQEVSWGLSAKDFIGGSSARHVALQTAYWECVADLGLRRGMPRKESGARNLAPAKWRAMRADELDKVKKASVAAFSDRQKAAQALSGAKKQAEALTAGLEAITQGELVYRPAKNPEAMGSLRTVSGVERPILPQSLDLLQKWREAVRPFWSTLVGFAKRIASIQEREIRVSQLMSSVNEERAAHLRTAARQAKHERTEGIKFGQAQKDTQIIARARVRGERQR